MRKIFLFIVCIALSNLLFSQMKDREEPDYSKKIMTEEVMWHLGRVTSPQVSPDGTTILFGIKYFNYKTNKGNLELYTMPVKGGNPKQITNTPYSEAEAIWRPDGKKIGYLCNTGNGMQIWECNPDGTDNKQISNVPEGVNGFSYSPDQSQILYISNVRLDPRIVDTYPDLPEANAYIYDDLMYRHWNEWRDGTYSHIFIASYPAMTVHTELLKGEKFQSPVPSGGGMEQITWSPDSKKIAYTCKKESGKKFAESTNSDIFIYDLETKNTINLTGSNPGYDMDPVFSPNGEKIVWWSMKTPGFESDKKRLMIYDFKSKTAEDYSVNFDQSSSNFAWHKDNNTLFFLSEIEATCQIYSLNLKTKEITQLTKGDHDYTSLHFCANELIASKMSHSLPTEIFSFSLKDKKEKQLTFTNQEILSKINLAKTEKRWVTTTDGKKMLVWVILPPNFDATKKYPALLYCQGGPQQAVSQFFSYRWNFQVMASHGYVVIAPNRRGLPSFGSEWNDQISGDYGGQNMKDYLSAIDSISKEPYIDADRIGAVGASYGGFSVYWLAGNHNKRFKTFIAHCGMFNLESWYGTTEELFFANHDIEGPYWKTPRPKSYDFSPHKFVGKWDTPILVIHGGNDFRIPYTEGMQAFDVAQMKGISSRFLFFPEEDHFVSSPQNSILWYREFYKWLDKYLK